MAYCVPIIVVHYLNRKCFRNDIFQSDLASTQFQSCLQENLFTLQHVLRFYFDRREWKLWHQARPLIDQRDENLNSALAWVELCRSTIRLSDLQTRTHPPGAHHFYLCSYGKKASAVSSIIQRLVRAGKNPFRADTHIPGARFIPLGHFSFSVPFSKLPFASQSRH